MKNNINTVAVILAAGSGTRYDKELSKQYECIDDKTVLYHSVKPFIGNYIDKIYVVINKNHLNYAKKALCELKISKFINGGKTRQESVLNALSNIKSEKPKKILIHDAARPNISIKIIKRVIKYLNFYDAVIPIIKINDAVKKINRSNFIIDDINKDELVLAQTPQGFTFEKIIKSHINNNKANHNDDAALLNKNMNKVFTIDGDYQNIKITTKKDLETIKSIMNKKIQYLPITALGIDIHKFSLKKYHNNNIKLGATKIPYEKKLIGHSDADVVIHALVDSLLGTIAEGDIGSKFNNKDIKWKNADSKIFLDFAIKKILENHCKIIHTDITIICEFPKIEPYRQLIQNNIAKLLSISKNNISIKATTTEKLGYLGRGEGIMVQCLTTVLKHYNVEKI